MLGIILRSLTNPAEAEAALLELGNPRILGRVRTDAQAEGTTAGAFAARAVRHLLDHAGEEVWLELLGAMARTPKPGVAALGIILRKALTEPLFCADEITTGLAAPPKGRNDPAA